MDGQVDSARFDYILSLFEQAVADTTYHEKNAQPPEDAKKLKRNGIITPIRHEELKGFAWPFCLEVLKKAGWRCQIILWPEEGDITSRMIFGYRPSLNIYNCKKYLSFVWLTGPALRVDLKASSYQMPLALEASRRLCFWAGGANSRWYIFRRLPVGHTLSPEIMQIAMSTLMGDERFKVKPLNLHPYIADTWIDDARILATKHGDITIAHHDIMKRVAECGAIT
ncbi:unnamed protein product [Trypanosoma congolense IL3000]|uniref:WGS project CAEQ00000000 data, annotated contig 1789 n=1 Tax=Trypanosoma congolense (strain IL3000) TaxID=1068625 RepID=F9W8W2_TRYCI|nr:unnamed protein product [Trypanosoma congolense IL3000]